MKSREAAKYKGAGREESQVAGQAIKIGRWTGVGGIMGDVGAGLEEDDYYSA